MATFHNTFLDQATKQRWAVATILSFVCMVLSSPINASADDFPGTIIDYVPPETLSYVGCPSIAILPNGNYVASHSYFGGGTTNDQSVIFGSQDQGKTWQKLADLDGQWWSNLFVHNDALYIMGVDKMWGSVAIRRSTDGGQTWTTPTDSQSGLLRDDGQYHTAPVPMVIHDERIWRAMEVDHAYPSQSADPHPYSSFVMSAPIDADLLDASSWTATNFLEFDVTRVGKEPGAYSGGWREGNVVVTPDGDLVNFLRIDDAGADRADILSVSDDGTQISFDDENWGLVDFPGGRTKFTIRYDPVSQRYWSLTNKQTDPTAERNILVLTSSADLKNWDVNSVILSHPDTEYHGFQYVDWQFDGNDLVAVSRTAFENAHNYHDANYLTFHRITDFRTRTMEAPPLYSGSYEFTNGNFESTPFDQSWVTTDPVLTDEKQVVYQTRGLDGTGTAAWIQANEYNSSTERAEFSQRFEKSSPEWSLEMTFACTDPNTSESVPNQRALHMYIPFNRGGVIIRVTEDGHFQIYDQNIEDYVTLFSDAVLFSEDNNGDKDFCDEGDVLNAYRIRIEGHFASKDPV